MFCSNLWVLVLKISPVPHLPVYIPNLFRSFKVMVTIYPILVDTDLVWLQSNILLYCQNSYICCSSVWVLVGEISPVQHLPSYIPSLIQKFQCNGHKIPGFYQHQFGLVVVHQFITLLNLIFVWYQCVRLGWQEDITSTALTQLYLILVKKFQ